MVRATLNPKTQTYNSGRIDRSQVSDRPKVDIAEAKKNRERQRARDAELMVGVFKNLEAPNGSLRFGYKKYHGDPFETYELYDGETYQIPRGVVKHLNNNCFYKEYRHLKGEFGEAGVRGGYNDGRLNAERMHEARKVHRFAFLSLDYMDDADIDVHPAKPLYEVSAA